MYDLVRRDSQPKLSSVAQRQASSLYGSFQKNYKFKADFKTKLRRPQESEKDFFFTSN